MLSKTTPVIILCGGEGSRIADVSRDAVPKPLIRIGDKPILWHIMKMYEAHGFINFILALGLLTTFRPSHLERRSRHSRRLEPFERLKLLEPIFQFHSETAIRNLPCSRSASASLICS
jgi:NDP-sugar pyrophosphorylase family protein